MSRNKKNDDYECIFHELEWTENKIGDEGCEMMVDLLKSNSALTSLNIGCDY